MDLSKICSDLDNPEYSQNLYKATLADADGPFGSSNLAVNITSPADGGTYDSQENVAFSCSVANGSGSYSYQWHSSIDSAFGSMQSFSYSDLSSGVHTVTVTVNDLINIQQAQHSIDVEIMSTNTGDTITVKDAYGQQVYGNINGSLSTAGNTIMFFSPKSALDAGLTYTVTLTHQNGIRDDGDNTLSSTNSLSFTTASNQVDTPSDLSFEDGNTGWLFAGDGDLVGTQGDVTPTHGFTMAAISTGSYFGCTAQSSSTSALTSGPIDLNYGQDELLIDYDFISKEFDTYVGSEFDDNFTITISGPYKSISEVVTSVNTIGVTDSTTVFLGGLYGSAQHTGWQIQSYDISQLGTPITLTFSITDVGDNIVDSIVLIDNIRFQ